MKTQRELLEMIFFENLDEIEESEERNQKDHDLTKALEPLRENFTLHDAIENAAIGLALYAERDGFIRGYQLALTMTQIPKEKAPQ